jgi:hypothetical protein
MLKVINDGAHNCTRPTTPYIRGCHNGRFWMKITIRTSSGRSPASAFTPRTRFYPRTGFTVRGHGKNPSARTLGCCCVRVDAPQRPHGHEGPRGHGASVRTHAFLPSPPLSLPPLPPPLRTQSTLRADARKKLKIKIKYNKIK